MRRAVGAIWGAFVVCAVASVVGESCGATAQELRLGQFMNSVSGDAIFDDMRAANLVDASCAGNLQAVQAAIKSGADPNAAGKGGLTPLLLAVACGNAAGVQALLQAGANPNYYIPREEGANPPRGGWSAVLFAATLRNPTVLRLLLQFRGDPNAAEVDGPYTALNRALDLGTRGGGWENYEYLLDAGANINLQHADMTIADDAAALGQFDKVVDLLNRGCSQNLRKLARITQQRVLALDSPQNAWRDKAILLLKARGIAFPVPSEFDEHNSGIATMAANGNILVHWSGGHYADQIVAPHNELFKPGTGTYADLLNRLGVIYPGESKAVPRRVGDPMPIVRVPGAGFTPSAE